MTLLRSAQRDAAGKSRRRSPCPSCAQLRGTRQANRAGEAFGPSAHSSAGRGRQTARARFSSGACAGRSDALRPQGVLLTRDGRGRHGEAAGVAEAAGMGQICLSTVYKPCGKQKHAYPTHNCACIQGAPGGPNLGTAGVGTWPAVGRGGAVRAARNGAPPGGGAGRPAGGEIFCGWIFILQPPLLLKNKKSGNKL